jgi:hypothetical protein
MQKSNNPSICHPGWDQCLDVQLAYTPPFVLAAADTSSYGEIPLPHTRQSLLKVFASDFLSEEHHRLSLQLGIGGVVRQKRGTDLLVHQGGEFELGHSLSKFRWVYSMTLNHQNNVQRCLISSCEAPGFKWKIWYAVGEEWAGKGKLVRCWDELVDVEINLAVGTWNWNRRNCMGSSDVGGGLGRGCSSGLVMESDIVMMLNSAAVTFKLVIGGNLCYSWTWDTR